MCSFLWMSKRKKEEFLDLLGLTVGADQAVQFK
jgi:hypothetical protein